MWLSLISDPVSKKPAFIAGFLLCTRSLIFCVIANDLVITAASGADIKINQPRFGGNQWLLKLINRYYKSIDQSIVRRRCFF
ncbi:MFS transporter permease [Yersinia pseudotuberculosis]|uniref:MFS transporter permease n=1 Tax=Yersinia pseudotuberculosis TaxID=633 RepID=A0ABM7AGB3_YERPU|nr:MFS transporter permease [Yersinia pseudotuberculosis]AYW86406.1 MFS transporter permease [Yersinia pseudotuberculosis]AYW91487.1 MFS transporter permease [Yersinia pseudotuberculosis]AYW95330.1 MFS transporter permease [Yersinia pseudotuberculosis]AYX01043.1 MFS transporter permease [Yersinia pseudotuberculosis]